MYCNNAHIKAGGCLPENAIVGSRICVLAPHMWGHMVTRSPSSLGDVDAAWKGGIMINGSSKKRSKKRADLSEKVRKPGRHAHYSPKNSVPYHQAHAVHMQIDFCKVSI